MSRRIRSILLSALVALSLATALGACGSSTSSSSGASSAGGSTGAQTVGTAHAIVGFAAHAGLAFGAFKLFVYNPYKAGTLSLHHPFTLAKAVAGALFAVHEIKKARAELVGHPKLAKLALALSALGGVFALVRSHLTHGSTGGISNAQSGIGSASSQASALGAPIQAATSGFHL